MKKRFRSRTPLISLLCALIFASACGLGVGASETTTASAVTTATLAYPIVDTNQAATYDSAIEINAPSGGDAYYGQDAQFNGNQPDYTDNGDGTVTDNVTGLMWQQSPDTDGDGYIDANDKLTWSEAQTYPETLNAQAFAGHTDWRLPTIKELYSLIDFNGVDPSGYEGSDTTGLVPFIDTGYFDFGYGDTEAGERIIDAQFASSNQYVSTTMNGNETVFGVNFADGRIKGYPTGPMPGQSEGKGFYVLYVRGNTGYGINALVDNGDGTLTDEATGLMWTQGDSGMGMDWEAALAYAAQEYLGYDDWRLPNVKELQSIVDYDRSPDTTDSAAIDPLFQATEITNEAGQADYACYWSSTTHANWTNSPGVAADYVAFGRAMGYVNGSWIDVHGAGAQRSDPKAGDASDYPTGRGPQGDAIRIDNMVRLVRDADGAETPTVYMPLILRKG